VHYRKTGSRDARRKPWQVPGSTFWAWGTQCLARRALEALLSHPGAPTADVLPLLLQGRCDLADSEAFRSLEIAIRDAAGLGAEPIGTDLAARAFHPPNGEVTDLQAEAGERQALMNLMTGALGSYKNSQSHRHVGLEAAEARGDDSARVSPPDNRRLSPPAFVNSALPTCKIRSPEPEIQHRLSVNLTELYFDVAYRRPLQPCTNDHDRCQ
jgi:hypothetical protein